MTQHSIAPGERASRTAGRGRRFEIGRAVGLAFDPPPGDADRQRFLEWLEQGRVPDGETIKAGRVYAYGAWIVKLFERGPRLRDVFRPSPAFRCARHHANLRGVRTPRPIAALGFRRGRSLVVLERIVGRTLDEVMDDSEAVDRFVRMMAAMHAARVFHGDLHPSQVLWDGHDWFLLDLDGLRHPLRALQRRTIIEGQWARLCRTIPAARLAGPFREYLAIAGHGWDPDAAWERVQARTERLLSRIGAPAPGSPLRGGDARSA